MKRDRGEGPASVGARVRGSSFPPFQSLDYYFIYISFISICICVLFLLFNSTTSPLFFYDIYIYIFVKKKGGRDIIVCKKTYSGYAAGEHNISSAKSFICHVISQ